MLVLPAVSCLLFPVPFFSGDEGARTLNPCLAKAVLSQLSYVPFFQWAVQESNL